MTTSENTVNNAIKAWIDFLSNKPIPVLKLTARELQNLKEDENKLTVRNITPIVLHDPFMVFRVLSYAKQHPSKHQQQDLIQVEQAILMMGTNAFYRNLPTNLVIEDQLKDKLPALGQLLKIVKRTHRATYYATDWAAYHKDLRSDEVHIGTLLHDLAEMLLWCFAPNKMLNIAHLQQADKTLRSKVAQERVLGFKISDLQKALVENFQLPPLLSKLMDDENSNDHHATNVRLAINLARHSANGWDDAALPDDYKEIAAFLRVDVEKAKAIIGVPTGETTN
ncbi:MAG TPA: HDOD domain-containing protein [Methylotenera sp.]|nr:HDOD domain-containing protein [Methylotenera sp.]HPH05106.1 HDOD domain-containing protein [Methylotenera sp.]HPN00470.1 HDOD domain-containing protein [Methylotenera sp.]